MPDDQFKRHCLLSPDVRPLIKACPSKSQPTNFHRASQERARIIAERCGGRGGGDVERPGLPERGDRQNAEAHQVGEDLVERGNIDVEYEVFAIERLYSFPFILLHA